MEPVYRPGGKRSYTYKVRKPTTSGGDSITIEEKKRFQNGDKLIAILTEACSTGISLQVR
jgi:hypothetical protein